MRAFRVAYDGRPFHGFQRQPDVPTVSDAILDALRDLGVLDSDDVPPGYAAAGRTDAGVSARAQTVAFAAPDWLDPAALNSALPADVRAWAHADVPEDFHATHDAQSRTYTYVLYAPPDRTDDGRARAALDALAGEHDFHNLTTDDTGTVRTLETDLSRDGDVLHVTVTAGGFPRQLVRRLVAVVAEQARDDAESERIERVLADEALPGPAGVAPAPADPLVLVDVAYPGVAFTVDADAAASARAVFGERHRRRVARARVAGLLSTVGSV